MNNEDRVENEWKELWDKSSALDSQTTKGVWISIAGGVVFVDFISTTPPNLTLGNISIIAIICGLIYYWEAHSQKPRVMEQLRELQKLRKK